MSAIGSPCLGCTDRQVGCHGNCEKYKAFKEVTISRSREVQRQKREEAMYHTYRSNAFKNRREK